MKIQHLPMDEISLDPRLQMREKMSEEAIEDYAAHIDQLPPSRVIMDDDGKYWLTTWHRYHAHKKAGHTALPCEVIRGNFDDALREAAGANSDHGVRRSNDDKRKAILTLFAEPNYLDRSDNMIAEICKVSDGMVARVRATLKPTTDPTATKGSGDKSKSDKRTGKDGVSRPAKKIFCDKCVKFGPQPNCVYCAELRGKKPKAAKTSTEPEKPKSGAVLFDWKPWESTFGSLMREIDKFGNAYKCKETPRAAALRQTLKMFKVEFRQWYRETTGQKPPTE